ncbi:VCBS repeat-containing protein, partial [Klebsiella pneumoniae]|nr:VCBS repeat-containing protein [Klebsiella pneumoniae]
AFSEVALPNLAGGARAAVWADATGDGLPDLLLAAATGPRLYTNLGKGQFRDDTVLLPPEPCYHPAAAAWGDFDADGKPDILVATRFDGLRLFRN